MPLDDFAITFDELTRAIRTFTSEQCERSGDHIVHKNCGGAIRRGFLDLFYLNEDGSFDPGEDGFGIGPKAVPYCEKCFPPDGFKYTYAVRFPILRERKENPKKLSYVWGNREAITGSQRLIEG